MTDVTPQPRSWLYVPGDQPELLAKAPERGADALICDLEDAVAVDRKAAARQAVHAFLQEQRDPTSRIWIRINAANIVEDVAATVHPAVSGFVLAKAEPDVLAVLERTLTATEQRLGFTDGRFGVVALIETAQGLLAAHELAERPRVRNLALGEADLSGALGITSSDDDRELLPLRLRIVVASAAAGIAPPTGSVSTDFRDLDAFRASTQALFRLGFRARSAIHPAQVAVINEVLTPSAADVERARRLVDAFDRSLSEGAGVLTDDDGRMVDAAVVRSARDVLSRATNPNED